MKNDDYTEMPKTFDLKNDNNSYSSNERNVRSDFNESAQCSSLSNETIKVTLQNDVKKSPRCLPIIISFFLPGAGQLLQKRFLSAFILFFSYASIIAFSCYLNKGISNELLYPPRGTLVLFCLAPVFMFSSLFDALGWKMEGSKSKMIVKPWEYLVIMIVLIGLCPILIPEALCNDRFVICQGNLKQIAVGLYNYADTYGRFPPAWTVDSQGKPLHSWRVLILPYLQYQFLYNKIRLPEPWDSEYNRQFHDQMPPVFQCQENEQHGLFVLCAPVFPHLKPKGKCSYSIVIGKDSLFSETGTRLYQKNKGLISDKTIMLIERIVPICWMDPSSELTLETVSEGINCRIDGAGSVHNKGCLAAMTDGTIQKLDDDISLDQLKKLLTLPKTDQKKTQAIK